MKNKTKLIATVIMVGLFLLMFIVEGFAKIDNKTSGNSLYKPYQTTKLTRSLSNIGNWAYWIEWDGESAYDPILSTAGGYYPRGTTTAIFQDGIVWGAFVRDNISQNPRVGGQTYNIGTSPGKISVYGTTGAASATAELPSDPLVRLYKIDTRFTVPWDQLSEEDQANALDVLRPAVAEEHSINQSQVSDDQIVAEVNTLANDWVEWPADRGAPSYPDGTPGIAGADQVIWFVCNDLDTGATSQLYGSVPMGIELQVTLWAYNQPSTALGQVIFKQYKMINKSGVRFDSMYVAQWSDPDLGDSGDDFAGCDTVNSIGFAYNGYLVDNQYQQVNLPPPAAGYDFFQGPLVVGKAGQDRNKNGIDDAEDFGIKNLVQVGPGFINLPMTAFSFFAAGSPISDPPLRDYGGTTRWYKMLRGYVPNNDDASDLTRYLIGSGPGAGEPTQYPLAGDPFRETGDLDGRGGNFGPGDRRIVLSSGPFTMQPGDTQEVVVAVVGGIIAEQGGNNRNAVEQLKLNDVFAQILYDSLFKAVPKPPAEPAVTVTPFESEISLIWGSNLQRVEQTETEVILGFEFEGYNVYQLPSASSTISAAKLVATFDIVNNVTIIRAPRFVPSYGDVVTVPIRYGTDNGVQRFFNITKDYINDRPLYPGNEYYFAVTAYNYNPEFPDPSLESKLNILTIIPQNAKPGDEYQNMPGDKIDVTKVGPSTGSVEVTVVDPAAVNGDSYQVDFNDVPQYTLQPIIDDSTGMITGYDTLGTWYTWNLINSTTNTTLAADQTNMSGDLTYPIFDGILVQVMGPKTAGLADWDYAGTRWVSGYSGLGGDLFFGGLVPGYDFFGSELGDADMVPVHLEFQDQADVDANGFVGKGAYYTRPGYAHAGTMEAPFAGYDMSDANNPRRINISFVEAADNSNGIWDMGWDGTEFAALGNREYIFINLSDYDEGANYDDNHTGLDTDVLYGIWPVARGTHPYLEAEWTMDILANIPNKPGDVFTFSTEAFVQDNQSLAKDAVEKINVFPNPYYAFNSDEQSRFDRFVTFTHLPRKATIRIFNLAGVQVRKIEKNSTSQLQQWDLHNEANLPVASGMYIVYVDMPDLGKQKVLKLMIIQPQQVLERY
jgi:hypothetical protein